MYSVCNNNIELTRGDSFLATVEMYNDDERYEPQEGDVITFTAKKSYGSAVAIQKNIPASSLLLKLDPEDTANLAVTSYVYDIDIVFADGRKDTFIKGKLKLTPEV